MSHPAAARPDRFAGDSDRPSFAFFPFGAGSRRCTGEPFARAETRIALAGLAGVCDLERVTGTFERRASLTAVPDPPVRLTPRAVG